MTLVAIPLSLIFALAYIWTSDEIQWGFWTFDPYPAAWYLPLIGVPALLISLHVMNAVAFLSGRLVRVMLGRLGCSDDGVIEGFDVERSVTEDAGSAPMPTTGAAPTARRSKGRVIGLRALYFHIAIFIIMVEMMAISIAPPEAVGGLTGLSSAGASGSRCIRS